MKQCTKCLRWRRADLEFFAGDRRLKCGLTSCCRDCIRAASRATQKRLRDADPDGYREYRRQWRAANPDKARRIWKRADVKKAQTPGGVINLRMRGAIGRVLRARGIIKRGRIWEDLLGYTADDLRSHIEKQFRKGMSWGNVGEWHLDHIRPLSAFEFTSVDDAAFRDAWALSNLRPLWASDNHKKYSKRLFLV